MIDAFPGYAEGWNYLGLIALEREDFARAEDHFRKTIEVGRRLFPKRVARSSWWSDEKTRPYMRGLRNLAVTLLRIARYEEAMAVADRLELECGDDLAASSYRGAIALNTGDWELAAGSAGRLRGLWPEEGMLEAFARVELGEQSLALEAFLHAALTKPRAVRLVLGVPSTAPKTSIETEDHNAGVNLAQLLSSYLGKKKKNRGVTFLRRVVNDARVRRSMHRVEELQGKWFGHPAADRSIFDELTHMQKPDFAASQARLLCDLAAGTSVAGPAGPAVAPAHEGAARHSRSRAPRRSLH